VQRDAAGGEIDGCKRPRTDALLREIGGGCEELPQGEHGHRRERRRGDHAAKVLEDLPADARAVHPADGEDGEDENGEEREPGGRRSVDIRSARAERRRETGDDEQRRVEREPRERPNGVRA
jgi:hypothetical protein